MLFIATMLYVAVIILKAILWSRCPARNHRVAGSIPDGDIYFHFEFFACFPSLQVGGTLANEINHDHSPVVNVVFDPRYD